MRDRTTAPDQSVNKTASQSDDIIRITQLEDQLEQSQDKCHLLERQVVQLKHSLSSYQHLSRPAMEGEREKERGGERKAEREIERENEREKERQELLKEKEGEINELKTKLLTVQVSPPPLSFSLTHTHTHTHTHALEARESHEAERWWWW